MRKILLGMRLAPVMLAAVMVVQAHPVIADSAEIGPSSSLEDLIEYAFLHNPALRAARSRHSATLESVAVSKALPDPNVSVAVAAVPVETRVGPQHGRLSVSQTVPGNGKRDAREAEALAAVESAAGELSRATYLLAYRVEVAYYDLYLARRSLEITRENRDLLIHLEEVVRRAYSTGKAEYADLLRIQLEIGTLENDVRSLQDLIIPRSASLNTLLHRPVYAELPNPILSASPPPLLPEEGLRQMVSQSAPDLLVVQARLKAADRSVESIDLDAQPDLTFSVSYMPTGPALDPTVHDSGRDPLAVGLGINVPLWKKKYRAASRAARARRQAVLDDRNATIDSVQDRVEQSFYTIRNAEREVALYRDTLIPKAEQSLDAALSGFTAGTIGLLDLVEAQRVLLQFQLSLESALAGRARSVAELRMLLGTEVLRDGSEGDGPS